MSGRDTWTWILGLLGLGVTVRLLRQALEPETRVSLAESLAEAALAALIAVIIVEVAVSLRPLTHPVEIALVAGLASLGAKQSLGALRSLLRRLGGTP